MQLIEHLSDIMPRDSSGEGYDYDAFLDVLVNGGGGGGGGSKEEQFNGNNSNTAIGNGNAKKDTTVVSNKDGRGTTMNTAGKENELRDVASSPSNVSALAVAEVEDWASPNSGSMARRSRHYL
jgi:hypothetical protein